ncbi:MAG: 50S ribosomal protein L25 [Candidatus Omnitrophota bacterium]|nr:MAG: 50S ribosomal protein L25 [Candidatus Omnitrophota bacterium]HDN86448.1 50S ribosomal protein L25 [Candidatus Omnitrophota bacterium]
MEKVGIKALKRDKTGKEIAKKLRKEGFIPAVIYGKDLNIPIKVPITELKTLKAYHFSESSIIEIILEDCKEKANRIATVIKDIQLHPLTEEVLHMDFLKVSMKERIRVKVPLVLKGEPQGVKEGGVLEQMLWELEVEALPLEIPEKIEVDVSSLQIGHSIHVGDIHLTEKIRILEDPGETIITIVAKKEEEVEEEVEEVSEEPEVIKEKKPQEEG